MSHIPKVKSYTYEELAKEFDITPNKAHIEVRKVYNKIISSLVNDHKFNVWDSVMGVRDFFGMSEKEAVDKLTPEFQERLKREALKKYHVPGVSGHETSD